MRYIYVILTVLILSLACNAESSPNTPPSATLPASPNTPAVVQPTPPPTTIQPTTSHSDEAIRVERDAYKQVVEAHQKTLATIEWAIGIIGSLLIILVGYVVFKNNREYKDALEQAKEAKNDAKEACKEARHWESEAKQILGSIKEQVEAEIENIKKQGKESIKKIDDKSEKERRINELWNTALRLGDEGKYEESCDKYAEIVKLEPDLSEAYNNWGVALRNLAELKGDEKLFEQACRKYDLAIKIKPDYLTYKNWGGALGNWAKLKIGKPEYEGLLKQAEEKDLKAESLKKGEGAYNLACIYASRDKGKCREWLLVGQEAGTLLTRDEAMNDSDFENVRNEAWFKEIKWKGEK
jgi:tetratricopeptide (TPR) repeat protein